MGPLRRLRLLLPSQSLGAGLVARPGAVGGWVLAVLASSLLLMQLLLGRFPFGEEGNGSDFFVALLHCLSVGYLTGAYLAVLRSGRRSWGMLAGRLPPGAGPQERLLPPLGRPARGWYVALGAGIAVGFVGPYLSEPDVQGVLGWWRPWTWTPEVFWHRVLGFALGAEVGLFAFAVAALARGLAPVVRVLPFPDLMDPRPFQPVVAHGMTNGLAVAGLLSVMSLFALDLGLTPLLAVFAGLTAVLIAVSTLLPLRGIRERIRSRKAEERAWCDAGIRRAREALRKGESSGIEPRLSDLVAYRHLVDDVPEWPLDTPAFRRIALYLAIPLGSWVASALVQHQVEQWMGGG